MTCREAQERLVDLFDATPPDGEPGLRAHLAACPACSSEHAALQATLAAIAPPAGVQPSPDFKRRVLERLSEPAPPAPRWRVALPRWAVVAVAAALLLLAAPFIAYLGREPGQPPAPVLSLIAQSIRAMSGLRSVHLHARMRTRPAENFEYINPDLDWVPLEMWKDFDPPAKWRVEKPGRVVVMDGASALALIAPDHAVRGTPRANFLEWLNLFLDIDHVMESELRTARQGLSVASLAEEPERLVLTVRRRPRGTVTDDWLRDSVLSASDHTRTYTFDPVSKRLLGMELVLHSRAGDVPVFEVTEIAYDEPLNPALFSLTLPAEVVWNRTPAEMPMPAAGPPKSPREAAVMFFDALAREDWDQALAIYPYSGFSPSFQTYFGGLQVVAIGQPFTSSFYAGWYVPYEVRLKSGRILKHNLAVRNDNSAGRWVWDGGL